SSSGGTATYNSLVHASLLTTGDHGKPLPGIAREWTFSPDHRSLTFTLRNGVRFQDGSPVTAQDVAWTLEHTFGPKAAEYTTVGPVIDISKTFKNLEIVGPDTVTYSSSDPANVDVMFGLIENIFGDN